MGIEKESLIGILFKAPDIDFTYFTGNRVAFSSILTIPNRIWYSNIYFIHYHTAFALIPYSNPCHQKDSADCFKVFQHTILCSKVVHFHPLILYKFGNISVH